LKQLLKSKRSDKTIKVSEVNNISNSELIDNLKSEVNYLKEHIITLKQFLEE
jgi:hypothetical protein